MGKIRIRFCVWLSVCMFPVAIALTGCGGEEAVEENTVQRVQEGDFDYGAGSWKMSEELMDSQEPWACSGYWGDYMLERVEPDMYLAMRFGVLDGSDYYILERFMAQGETGEGCQKYYLTCLDMVSLEAEREELLLQGAVEDGGEELSSLTAELMKDLDENWTIIIGMDYYDGKFCLLMVQMGRESKAPEHCYAVWLDEGRRVERAVDLFQGMEQAGMIENNVVPGGILWDRQGYLYVGGAGNSQSVGVFEESGEFLKCVEAPNGSSNVIYSTCRLPDGRPVFECVDSDGKGTAIFCLEGQKEKMLYHGPCDEAAVRYLGKNGEIVYVGTRGVVRWNGETGKRERIFQDISLSPWDYEAVWESAEEEIILVSYESGSALLRKLRPGEGTETIVTFFMLSKNDSLKEYADEYSRQHPGIKIKVQELEETNGHEEAFNRFAMELVAEKGPDMFLLSRKDLEVLQDKGVLAEVSEFLPEGLEEKIFPGVLQYGTVEGKLYGISCFCAVNTIAVSSSVWPGETWDWKDILGLMEAGEASGGGFQSILGDYEYPSGKLLDILAILGMNAGQSSFLDREAGICRFATEDFASLLELCREYGRESGRNLSSGESLAYQFGGQLRSFSETMAGLGEGYHCVGYPVDSGFGGFVECSFCIAVNAKTEQEEIIRDFLKFVFSDRKQGELGILSVRRDILSGGVREHTELGKGPIFWQGNGNFIELAGKPDGSSFLPEYLDILEKGTALPGWDADMGGIILEEAEAYFRGDKTADEAAEIIQKRIQLYLEEQR